MPLVERARPKTLKDLILSPSTYSLFESFINKPLEMPHLILVGSPGTGKTSSALVLAKHLVGTISPFNFLQLNASSDRGVDTVRTQILSFVSNKGLMKLDSPEAPYKIVFLDEADSLTPDAQNALRNVMETYVENCRFILSCNNYQKIIPALKSRTLKIFFELVPEDLMFNRISQVIKENNLDYTEEQIRTACANSNGDFRLAYNYLGIFLDLQDPSLRYNLIEFILTNSLNKDLQEVYTLLKLKKELIENDFKNLFLGLCEHIVDLKLSDPLKYKILNRLAEAESAVLTGATEMVQFMGWYSYYRSLVL